MCSDTSRTQVDWGEKIKKIETILHQTSILTVSTETALTCLVCFIPSALFFFVKIRLEIKVLQFSERLSCILFLSCTRRLHKKRVSGFLWGFLWSTLSSYYFLSVHMQNCFWIICVKWVKQMSWTNVKSLIDILLRCKNWENKKS